MPFYHGYSIYTRANGGYRCFIGQRGSVCSTRLRLALQQQDYPLFSALMTEWAGAEAYGAQLRALLGEQPTLADRQIQYSIYQQLEVPIYGSSREGMDLVARTLYQAKSTWSYDPIGEAWYELEAEADNVAWDALADINAFKEDIIFVRGEKRYELVNHLGNVMAVITDRKYAVVVGGTVDGYVANVVSTADYYAFGGTLPGRTFHLGSYRYGFNGMEKDDEISGIGSSYYTMFRQYDPRLGRWMSVDPVTHSWMTPYNGMDNNPIGLIDPFGLSTGDDKVTRYDNSSIPSNYKKGDSYKNASGNWQTGDGSDNDPIRAGTPPSDDGGVCDDIKSADAKAGDKNYGSQYSTPEGDMAKIRENYKGRSNVIVMIVDECHSFDWGKTNLGGWDILPVYRLSDATAFLNENSQNNSIYNFVLITHGNTDRLFVDGQHTNVSSDEVLTGQDDPNSLQDGGMDELGSLALITPKLTSTANVVIPSCYTGQSWPVCNYVTGLVSSPSSNPSVYFNKEGCYTRIGAEPLISKTSGECIKNGTQRVVFDFIISKNNTWVRFQKNGSSTRSEGITGIPVIHNAGCISFSIETNQKIVEKKTH